MPVRVPPVTGLASGFIPNLAKVAVQTARGNLTTQQVSRVRDGNFAKIDGEKMYLGQFSKEDQALIKGFEAPNSKANIAAARGASLQKKKEMPTIDASRQATMLVATENYRKKIDTTFKKEDGI